MTRSRWMWMAATWLAAWPACTSSHTDTSNEGQTHWLHACDSDAECGGLSCLCGVCIAECEADGACAVAGRETDCVEPGSRAAHALCGGDAPMPVCLEPCGGGCSAGQRCAGDHCVGAAPSGAPGGGADAGEPERDAGRMGGAGAGMSGSSGTEGGSGVGGGGGMGVTTEAGNGSEAGSGAGGTPELELDCTMNPVRFPEFERGCTTASDCAVARHETDCCANLAITGVSSDQVADFESAAALCAEQLAPQAQLCDCGPSRAYADDGTSVERLLAASAALACVGGVCTTGFPSAEGRVVCGPEGLTCDAASELCVVDNGWLDAYACEPIPGGCEADRSCGCVAASLCAPGFGVCNEVRPGVIGCTCLNC